MIFSGIIWNTSHSHHNAILSDISNEYDLVNIKTLNLKDKYQDFIVDIYSDDNLSAWRWKLDKK